MSTEPFSQESPAPFRTASQRFIDGQLSRAISPRYWESPTHHLGSSRSCTCPSHEPTSHSLPFSSRKIPRHFTLPRQGAGREASPTMRKHRFGTNEKSSPTCGRWIIGEDTIPSRKAQKGVGPARSDNQLVVLPKRGVQLREPS